MKRIILAIIFASISLLTYATTDSIFTKTQDRVSCGGVNHTVYYDANGWDTYVVFSNTNNFSVDVDYEIYGKKAGIHAQQQYITEGTCSIEAGGKYTIYLPQHSSVKGSTTVYKSAYYYR